ncbi:MAG: hypothetical protein CMM87_05240 [Rickettsiales bacterium]|nr:hypothetical protein [Rickettsiales bacterium]
MKTMNSKEEAQRYARLLKNFYGELYSYILANAAIIFLWALFDGGHFWPIWIILIWGATLVVKASKLHIIDHSIYTECDKLRDKFLFMKKDWEERKVEQLVKRAEDKGLFKEKKADTASSTKAASAPEKPAATTDKSAAKAPAKKPAVKKAPAKKPAAKKPAVSKTKKS